MDPSTSVAKVLVKYDEIDRARSGASSKWIKNLSKSWKIVKRQKTSKLKKSQKLSVWKNIYWSTDFLSIEEHKLPLEFWQFFELFFTRPKNFFNITFGVIIVMAKLMELLMLCYVFDFKKLIFFELFYTDFLSIITHVFPPLKVWASALKKRSSPRSAWWLERC